MSTEPHESRRASTRRAFVAGVGATLALAVGRRQVRALAPLPGEWDVPALLVLALADLHSSHERHAALLARVDEVLASHPGVPALAVIDGDVFERGNVVALRGEGRLDLALVGALARRVPVVVNLGNHEGALFPLADAVRRLRAVGATVVSNVRDRDTGAPLADATVRLDVGGLRVAVAGVATDDLATYRPEVRRAVSVPDSPTSVRALVTALPAADVAIVLSHDGVRDDRVSLSALPDGVLLVGAHDHLRFAHRSGRTLYVHNGFWGESFSAITASLGAAGPLWTHAFVHVPAEAGGGVAADTAFAAEVRAERARHLRGADLAPVGWTARAWAPREAARLAAVALRDAAGVDVALVGNTTFGAGLPGGAVSRHAFDAFVRFDGGLARTAVDGRTLRTILAHADQVEGTPFARRTGEFLISSSPSRRIADRERYAVVVNAFAVSDEARARAHLGIGVPPFAPIPGLRLKALVAARLARGV